jgi:hypothetical protein
VPNRTIGSLEPGLIKLTVCNHHDTLAQLRPPQAMVAYLWYQSRRHVAFVQHGWTGLAGAVQVALQKSGWMELTQGGCGFFCQRDLWAYALQNGSQGDGRNESGNG